MNKQIEEMAKALTRYEYSLCERLPKDKCLLTSAVHAQVSCDYCKIAEFLVNEGYRKSTDVAREIFEEIRIGVKMAIQNNLFEKKKRICAVGTHDKVVRVIEGKISVLQNVCDYIDFLEKKYESEGADDEP